MQLILGCVRSFRCRRTMCCRLQLILLVKTIYLRVLRGLAFVPNSYPLQPQRSIVPLRKFNMCDVKNAYRTQIYTVYTIVGHMTQTKQNRFFIQSTDKTNQPYSHTLTQKRLHTFRLSTVLYKRLFYTYIAHSRLSRNPFSFAHTRPFGIKTTDE